MEKTKRARAREDESDRHDVARAERRRLVSALARCSCTWPLDVDNTTWHGHARACLAGRDLDTPEPRTDAHEFVGNGADCVDCGEGRCHHLHRVWDRSHHVMCPCAVYMIGDDPPSLNDCVHELCESWRASESAVQS